MASINSSDSNNNNGSGKSEQCKITTTLTTSNNSLQEITMNPEYASLVPTISESEYELIKQSIIQDGQLVPVIINHKGEILDGHTRFRACSQFGIKPKTMMREFQDTIDEKLLVIQINLKRRHLTNAQKVRLGQRLKPIFNELVARNPATFCLLSVVGLDLPPGEGPKQC